MEHEGDDPNQPINESSSGSSEHITDSGSCVSSSSPQPDPDDPDVSPKDFVQELLDRSKRSNKRKFHREAALENRVAELQEQLETMAGSQVIKDELLEVKDNLLEQEKAEVKKTKEEIERLREELASIKRAKFDDSEPGTSRGTFTRVEPGAQQLDASHQLASAAAGSSGSNDFPGAVRLGDAVKPTEKVGGMDVDESSVEPATVTVVVRTWRNGFSIDDEPLRTLEDVAEREFLEHIAQGSLPPELLQARRGRKINLETEDHRDEDYQPPPPAFNATGQDQTSGSPVPQVVGAGMVEVNVSTQPVATGPDVGANAQVSLPPVDESKPTTRVQVRLGNGERLVLKLNNHHTVKQLREFISQMRPDLAGREFVLMTCFPSKELTNEMTTLEEANLLNAVIIQRFK